MGLIFKKVEFQSILNRRIKMLEEMFVSNEENKEKVVDDSTAFFDDIVNNLNLLKKFSISMDERILKIEELVEKMIAPLEDLKKIMLD